MLSALSKVSSSSVTLHYCCHLPADLQTLAKWLALEHLRQVWPLAGWTALLELLTLANGNSMQACCNLIINKLLSSRVEGKS